jgi:SAM-dependent methyltransferase
MSADVYLTGTACPICGSLQGASTIYPPNFEPADLNPQVFSARRLPDRIHYRMVRCDGCGLVRSDPIADPSLLASLYRESAVTYSQEIANLRKTYGDYLRRLEKYGSGKNSLLEIGCGNGFFLEEALDQGYARAAGVEPSRAAVESAGPRVAESIRVDIMRPGLFAEGEFDAICMFQVLDHIPDPNSLLDECRSALARGGAVLCLNHDVSALPNRMMGEKSPIVDVEHTFLYSPSTISRLFASHGFAIKECGPAVNQISARHLMHLLPAPGRLKAGLIRSAEKTGIANIPLRMPIGNLYLIAVKA